MITISRKVAIINDFVEIPNTKFQTKTKVAPATALAAISGSEKIVINGARLKSMQFIEFPAAASDTQVITDYYATLKGL